jgi:hypothetical protein
VLVNFAISYWYCQLLSPTHCQLRSSSWHSCSWNVQAAWRKVLWFSSASPARAVTCLNWARPVAVCYAPVIIIIIIIIIVSFGTAPSGQLEMTLNEPRMEREVNHSILHSHFQSVSLSVTRPHCPPRTHSLACTYTYNLMDVLILFISFTINVTAPGRDRRWIEDPGCPPGVSGLYCFSCVI